MKRSIYFILRTCYRENIADWEQRVPFGTASFSLSEVQRQVAREAVRILDHGLGNDFAIRDGECLQCSDPALLALDSENGRYALKFSGREITFFYAQPDEDPSTATCSVTYTIERMATDEDSREIQIDIPEGPLFDDKEVTCVFDTDERTLNIRFQMKADAERISRSLFPANESHTYTEEDGRVWVKRYDMNGSDCWDDYGAGTLESHFNGDSWLDELYRTAAQQLRREGMEISQVYTETLRDCTSDYLALDGRMEDLVKVAPPFPFEQPDSCHLPEQVLLSGTESVGNALMWPLPFPVPEKLPKGLFVSYVEPWDDEAARRVAEERSAMYDRHESTCVNAVRIKDDMTPLSAYVIISDGKLYQRQCLITTCSEPCCTAAVYAELGRKAALIEKQ